MEENRKKALMVINPTAGKQAIKGQMFSVIDTMCSNGYEPTVLTTAAKGDCTEFVRSRLSEYDIIVCCGGDGTLNEAITGMIDYEGECPPIGYVPCGTTNDMASSLGLPKTIKKAVKNVIEGTPHYHDIGKFGDMAYFSYIASFGAFTKVSYSTPQSAKNVFGHFAYVLNGAAELGNIKNYHVKLTFDDTVIEDDIIYLSITNTRSFAGLFSFPTDEVSLSDGLFEVLLVKNPKNVVDVSNILTNISKNNFNDEKTMSLFHTSKLRVELDEAVTWTIDGEQSPEISEVDIEVVANKIKICLPDTDK
ncbi:MAG: diacylglycerol kinase family lipid kinase [Clostridia bacterium]|nr:diacylglycerol kinase family lipid kinase [Clostridia bacterium]